MALNWTVVSSSCHQALAYSSRIGTSALKSQKFRVIENQTTLTHIVQPLVPKSKPASRIVKDKIKEACLMFMYQDLRTFDVVDIIVQEVTIYILAINIIE